MANYKSGSKGELVAIYRLEFYKNKKKWRFCKNDRQLRKDGPAKQKLNETYRVEDEPPEVELPEPLNDAFLEADSDEDLKEDLKPEPPPPTLRRWKNTILDMKPPPEERDWAIPNVKAEGWEPSIEPVRSYEDEWGEDAGWDGVERWGDDMQCVEQVYASELCLSGPPRARLPVFAGWPAHDAPPAEQNMLQRLVQNLAPQKPGQRPTVAEAFRLQMGGQLGQNFGQIEQNVGQMGQNIGQKGQNMGQMGQNNGQMGQNIGYMGQNYGQSVGQHMRQNTEILDHSLKLNTNQNAPYIEEPKIFKQNLYQNCKIGQIIEQNLKYDMKDFEQMEWEPERDLCELGRGLGGCGESEVCGGDACACEAAAALAGADGWLSGQLKHFYLEPALGEAPVSVDASLSSGDSAAFVRGAHARPHSSEVDLVLDAPCECASIPASKLAHMSSGALRDALRAYTLAARRVLHELRARAQHEQLNVQQGSALSRDVTHESVPTRDTAPQSAAPHVSPPHVSPPHVSPPHMSPGRGRGRRLLTK